MNRQIYLIGTMAGDTRLAVVLWGLGWFTDKTQAEKIAREQGYDVIPLKKNPTQP